MFTMLLEKCELSTLIAMCCLGLVVPTHHRQCFKVQTLSIIIVHAPSSESASCLLFPALDCMALEAMGGFYLNPSELQILGAK